MCAGVEGGREEGVGCGLPMVRGNANGENGGKKKGFKVAGARAVPGFGLLLAGIGLSVASGGCKELPDVHDDNLQFLFGVLECAFKFFTAARAKKVILVMMAIAE